MASKPGTTVLCVLLAATSACVPVAEEPTGTRLVSSASALALPPPGGPAVVGVVERRYSNALEQEISLETQAATPGQNELGVRVLGLGRAKGDDALLAPELSDVAIAAEMQGALPGVPMQISPFYVQNGYGPFGYAVGRGAGRDLCLYGWQKIGGEVTTPFVRQGAVETRLRLCEAGASERALLANMYGYTVQTAFGPGWSTGSAAPGPRLALGATGTPILPEGVVLVNPAPAAAPSSRPRPASAPAPAHVAAPAFVPAPMPSALVPAVPAPMPSALVPAVPPPGPLVPPPARPVPAGVVATRSLDIPRVPAPPVRVSVPSPHAGFSQ
jgi:hypothetical protein